MYCLCVCAHRWAVGLVYWYCLKYAAGHKDTESFVFCKKKKKKKKNLQDNKFCVYDSETVCCLLVVSKERLTGGAAFQISQSLFRLQTVVANKPMMLSSTPQLYAAPHAVYVYQAQSCSSHIKPLGNAP